MKFEAQQYKPTGSESPEMQQFLGHYSLVTRFLLQFNIEKFRLGTDVKLEAIDVLAVHNQRVAILHKQGLTGNLILQGRVQGHQISRVENGRLTIIPKLLTTTLVTPVFDKLVGKIQVQDPSLFQVGDKILVGSAYRTIANIMGNEFTLDENVRYANVYVVSLANDTLKAYVF